MIRDLPLSLVLVSVLFVGCERLPGEKAAAVHVDVSYDFNAGCIAVFAQDKAAPEKQARDQKEVLDRIPASGIRREADFAVYRGVDWGRTITIIVTAHEQTCDGPEVARQPLEATLNEAGRQTLPVSLTALDEDGDGWVAPSGNGRDCDDTHAGSNPSVTVETCDEHDNDCNDLVDDGLPTSTFHRDADGDGVGVEGDTRQQCRASQGYVAPSTRFDCDDTKATVKPGATELCNGEDEDCDGGRDEDFPQKNMTCTIGPCSGTQVCNAEKTALECNAPRPTDYYPDMDGDTEGDGTVAVQQVCPGLPAPAGKVANGNDCDDSDPHNFSANTEVCDDRDNNCRMGKDEEVGPTGVCEGKSWSKLTDSVTTARSWNTVAVSRPGGHVWLAGEGGALAVRLPGATTFAARNMACDNPRWHAAWARPSDGVVFLAGDGGNLAMYDGMTCTTVNTSTATGGTTSNQPLLGIVGFESGATTTVYVTSAQGHVFSWSPGTAQPQFRVQRGGSDPYRDIHGNTASRQILVGADDAGWEVRGYDGAASRPSFTVSGVPSANNGILNGVWAFGDTRAYAVGRQGNLLRRTGETTWSFASPDATMQVHLNSVVALDDASVYIASEDGKIRRPGRGQWVEHFNAGAPLRDIAATSRQDIWAVGHNFVVHFPELSSAALE